MAHQSIEQLTTLLFDQALAAVDKHPIVNTRTHDEFVPVERRRGEWESDLEMERRLA